MSKNNWKLKEEREISVADLVKKTIRSWKFILCCALICAMIFGGYKYYKDHKALKNYTEQETSPVEVSELTPAEKEGLAYAKALQSFLDGQDTYMEESILLKINPYQENRVALQYELRGVNEDDALGILEQCMFYINDGRMASDIVPRHGIETTAQYLQELICSDKLESANEISNNRSNRYFTVYVIGEDTDHAAKLADSVEKCLRIYGKSILPAPEQELVLLSRQDSVIYDDDLEIIQNTIRETRNAKSDTLNALVSQFSDAQMAEYNEINSRPDDTAELHPSATVSIDKKYVIAGLAIGIFIGCCWIVFFYLLNGKIKSTTDIEKNYDLCVYGTIKRRAKKATQKQQERDQILARIILNCHKNHLEKLLFISGHEMDETLKMEYDYFCSEIEKQGIKCTAAENMLSQMEMYEHIGEKDAVVVFAEAEKTSYQLFDKMLIFLIENNIPLSGVIVME
ncbi:MAG: hypothetical protein HFH28_11560 [Clostridiaceae bacterium]|nr:hypothetical protein [Clostridiaceae bacterium]